MEEFARFFEKEGYVIVRQALDPGCVDRAHEFLRSELSRAGAIFQRYEFDLEDPRLGAKLAERMPEIISKNVKAELDVFSGTFPLETRLSRRLWDLFSDPTLRSLLQLVLRSQEIFMHMAPSARFVPPGYDHAAVPAHRDITYNTHMTDFVTVWTPLVEINRLCGGVRVFRNSAKREGIFHEVVEKDPTSLWYKSANLDEYSYIDDDMKPSDILILHSHTLHSSRPNISKNLRLSIDMRFFGAQGRTSKHYLDLQRMEVFEPLSGEQHDRV